MPADQPTEKQTFTSEQTSLADRLKPQAEAVGKHIEGLAKNPSISGLLQLVVSLAELVRAFKGGEQPQQKLGIETGQRGSEIADIGPELQKSQQELAKLQFEEGAAKGSIERIRGVLRLMNADNPERRGLENQIAEMQNQLTDISLRVAALLPRIEALNVEQGQRESDVKGLNDRLRTGTSPARDVSFAGGRMTVGLHSTLTPGEQEQLQKIQKQFPGLLSAPTSGNPLVISLPGLFWSRNGVGAQARAAVFDFLAGSGAEPGAKQNAQQTEKSATEQTAKKTESADKLNEGAAKDSISKMRDELVKQAGEKVQKTTGQPDTKIDQDLAGAAGKQLFALRQRTLEFSDELPGGEERDVLLTSVQAKIQDALSGTINGEAMALAAANIGRTLTNIRTYLTEKDRVMQEVDGLVRQYGDMNRGANREQARRGLLDRVLRGRAGREQDQTINRETRLAMESASAALKAISAVRVTDPSALQSGINTIRTTLDSIHRPNYAGMINQGITIQNVLQERIDTLDGIERNITNTRDVLGTVLNPVALAQWTKEQSRALADAENRLGLSDDEYHREIVVPPGQRETPNQICRAHLSSSPTPGPLYIFVSGHGTHFTPGRQPRSIDRLYNDFSTQNDANTLHFRTGHLVAQDPREQSSVTWTHIRNMVLDAIHSRGMFAGRIFTGIRLCGYSYGSGVCQQIAQLVADEQRAGRMAPPVERSISLDGIVFQSLPPRGVDERFPMSQQHLHIVQGQRQTLNSSLVGTDLRNPQSGDRNLRLENTDHFALNNPNLQPELYKQMYQFLS